MGGNRTGLIPGACAGDEGSTCGLDSGCGKAIPGADCGATVGSSEDVELVFSGTSILSPSRSQRSGAGLASEQSTTHSRSWPVAGSRRVTLTWRRSEEVSTSLDWSRTGLSQKGVWATIEIVGSLVPCGRADALRMTNLPVRLPRLPEVGNLRSQGNVGGLSIDDDLDLPRQALLQIRQLRPGKARPILIQRVVGLGNLHDITPVQAHVFRAIAGLQNRAEINDLVLPAFQIGSGPANVQVRQVRKRQGWELAEESSVTE